MTYTTTDGASYVCIAFNHVLHVVIPVVAVDAVNPDNFSLLASGLESGALTARLPHRREPPQLRSSRDMSRKRSGSHRHVCALASRHES